MAYSLSTVSVERFSDVASWIESLEQIRDGTLGLAAVSLHGADVIAKSVTENLGAAAFALPTQAIDDISDGAFSITMGATKPWYHPKKKSVGEAQGAMLMNSFRGVGEHIDRTLEDVCLSLDSVAVTGHYTPYGEGIIEVAGLDCTREELAALSTWDAVENVAKDLVAEFNEKAVALSIKQGDMLGFIAHGQLTCEGEVYPMMHRVLTTSGVRVFTTSTD